MNELNLITLMPLFIFFTVGLFAGALYAYRLITTARKAMQIPGSLYAWPAVPLDSWRYEPEASSAILAHTLAILSLGLFAVGAVWNDGILSSPLFARDTTMVSLVWFVQCGSILVAGYQLGATLITFPLVVYRRKPVPAAITEKGMTFGRNFLPWSWFSRFAIEDGDGTLRLYSAFAPDLASMTLKLPDSILQEELAQAMEKFLPAHPAGSRAWYQTKTMLVPMMILLCLLFAAAGWLASNLSRELALFGIAVLITLLGFVGGRLLRLFAFGSGAARDRLPGKPAGG